MNHVMHKHIALVGATDRRVEELLHAAGMQVVSISDAALHTLAAPSARQPDALLLDLRGASPMIPSAVAMLRRQHPTTGVVIIAGSLDPALLVEAMRAGVNEVVAEPFGQQDLENAIARVCGHAAGSETGEVIGFIGAKGGVGTTTIAVNMATSLGHLSKPSRALLIDLHQSGGDAAVFAGADPRFSVMDAMDNTHRLDQSFLRSLVTQFAPGADLLASPERHGSTRLDTEKTRRVIEVAASFYRYTVIDVARSDTAVLDGLDALTVIYVVANQELATVKSAGRLTALLRQRYGRDKVSLVLTRSDRQADIAHEDVEKAVGAGIAHTFPSDYRVALQALNRGRPLALENHNALSASFRKFAHDISGIRPKPEPVKSSGLLGRLAPKRA
jgi:pilus assembly protein CpaE